jgi:hypothetical protein
MADLSDENLARIVDVIGADIRYLTSAAVWVIH